MNCFLDRDGVLNVNYPYVGTIDRFTWCPHIIDILQDLHGMGYRLILVTNQSGINRRFYSYRDFLNLSFFMLGALAKHSIELEINYCRHTEEDECKCRKPRTGMLDKYTITDRDIFIGDKSTDMMAAYSRGIPNRFLLSSTPCGPYTEAFQDHEALHSRIRMLRLRDGLN